MKHLIYFIFCIFFQSAQAQIVITSSFITIPSKKYSAAVTNEISIDAVKNIVIIEGTVNKRYLLGDISEDKKTWELSDFGRHYKMMFMNIDKAPFVVFVENNTEDILYAFSVDGTIDLKENKSQAGCSNFLYKTKLANTNAASRFIYDKETYSEPEHRIIELPENATLYVLKREDVFYYVCYNGISGYISKHILIEK